MNTISDQPDNCLDGKKNIKIDEKWNAEFRFWKVQDSRIHKTSGKKMLIKISS